MPLCGKLTEDTLCILGLLHVVEHRDLYLAAGLGFERTPSAGMERLPTVLGNRPLMDDTDLQNFVLSKCL
ncbi:Uncharacterised protein [Mycobacterium tuberculosis]|nr:Uncharacterised protein [Mycobacterium tuberculosis]